MNNLVKVSLLALVAISSAAQAAGVEWNGFGSAYYGQNLEKTLTYGGFTDNRSNFASFSLLGLNVGAKMDEHFSAAAQIIAENQDDQNGDWGLQARWAFLTYKASDSFNLKFGRQLMPISLSSEYDKVGFLLPYRTQPDAYDLINPYSGFNGVSANYTLGIGNRRLIFTGFGGRPQYDLPSTVTGGAEDLIGARVAFEGDGYVAQMAYNRSRAKFTNISTIGAVNYSAIVDVYTAGFRYDKHNFVTWAEIGQVKGNNNTPTITGRNFVDHIEAGYVLVGYRLGDFMPRYTYSRVSGDLGLSQGPTTFHSLGVNYQASTQVVAKVELQQVKIDKSGASMTVTRAAGEDTDSGMAVFAGLDFIF